MFRRTIAAATVGSLVGALLGTLALGLGAARLLDSGLTIPPSDTTTLGASITVSQAGMYLFVIVAGAVAGAILAMVGYAVSAQADPDARRYGLAPIASLGALIGGPVAFAASRAVVGLVGDIVDKMVVLDIFHAAIAALTTGAATGAIVVVTVERLSRPETLGLGGVAMPQSFGRFVRDATAAVGLPAFGLAMGAGVVYGLSRVLLEADKTVALIVFGGVAALILFGTALIASGPGRRRR